MEDERADQQQQQDRQPEVHDRVGDAGREQSPRFVRIGDDEVQHGADDEDRDSE